MHVSLHLYSVIFHLSVATSSITAFIKDSTCWSSQELEVSASTQLSCIAIGRGSKSRKRGGQVNMRRSGGILPQKSFVVF